MNVLVVGFGLIGGGVDAASYYVSHGHNVRVTDVRNEGALYESIEDLKAKGVVFRCEAPFDEDVQWADLIVKTHYMGQDDYAYPKTKAVVNDISVLLTNELAKDVKFVFVAGSKNKTITVSAMCHALNDFGHCAHMCGNMGISGFCELERLEKGEVPEYIIIELSFWQIRDTMDILDWDFPCSEFTVFTGVADQEALEQSNSDLFESIAMISNAIVCPRAQKRVFSELLSKLPDKRYGKVFSAESNSVKMAKALPFNMQWAFATLKRMGFETPKLNNCLKAFKGIPNRGELVCRTDSCLFINDSSSFLPESVAFAVDNFSNMRVHLICGGYGKSMDPAGMENALEGVASIHLLDGSFTNEKLIAFLKEKGLDFHGPFVSMREAVLSAQSCLDNNARIMQVVLLSPGVPALYFYKNEFYRGDCFRSAIEETVGL